MLFADTSYNIMQNNRLCWIKYYFFKAAEKKVVISTLLKSLRPNTSTHLEALKINFEIQSTLNIEHWVQMYGQGLRQSTEM